MKNIIKVICFTIIFLITFVIVQKIILPVWPNTETMKGFYNEKKNSLDVMFIGDSNIYSDISPLEIYEKYGITSYDYAAPAISNMLTYYMFKEVIKYQTPKVVVMDVTSIFYGKDQEASTRKPIDSMKLSQNKLDFITDPIYNFSLYDKFTFIAPFFRYHSRWNEVATSDITKLFKKYKSTTKGYIMNDSIKAATNSTSYMEDTGSDTDFSTDYMPEYVKKVNDLCNSMGIKLVVVSMPDTLEWNYGKHETMSEWSTENNITYIDYNLSLNDIGIDYSVDSYDSGEHLNISGATKMSSYIADYLHTNFDLPDHRTDTAYSSWNDDLVNYHKLLDEADVDVTTTSQKNSTKSS